LIDILRLDAVETERNIAALAALLRDAVDDGASVGFLAPLDIDAAQAYWRALIPLIDRGARVVLAARLNGAVVGSAQLDLGTPPNQPHRAELAKLLVHRRARRRGIGTALMHRLEAEARGAGRGLLMLDTRQGDAAEPLYRALGYTAAGIIPRYARSSAGTLEPTVIFYKELV